MLKMLISLPRETPASSADTSRAVTALAISSVKMARPEEPTVAPRPSCPPKAAILASSGADTSMRDERFRRSSPRLCMAEEEKSVVFLTDSISLSNSAAFTMGTARVAMADIVEATAPTNRMTPDSIFFSTGDRLSTPCTTTFRSASAMCYSPDRFRSAAKKLSNPSFFFPLNAPPMAASRSITVSWRSRALSRDTDSA